MFKRRGSGCATGRILTAYHQISTDILIKKQTKLKRKMRCHAVLRPAATFGLLSGVAMRLAGGRKIGWSATMRAQQD
jgi:hypothetical protein